MRLASSLFLLFAVTAPFVSADDGDVTFKSDVALVRVDAQVLDRDGRAVTGLRREDFTLTQNGRRLEIRNFAREEMPVDVVLLLDVSGSMRSHVQRMADASHDALRVLGPNDRVAIMVFDRATRVRLAFRSSKDDVEREFENLLRSETFNGGTDITRALLDAANYMRKSARKDARRAIVIMTDDQTERGRNEAQVGSALAEADTVLSAIIAPDAMSSRGPGGYPQGGGRRGNSWPRGSSIPDIIWGGGGGTRMPGGGGSRYPQGGGMGSRTQSAGTSEIARESGGDSMNIDDASAFETTLARIRQRYALYFQLPAGTRAGEEHSVQISLADSVRSRYPGADVRYRGNYHAPVDMAPATGADTTVVSQSQTSPDGGSAPEPARPRRRVVLDDSSGPRGPNPNVGAPAEGASTAVSNVDAKPVAVSTATATEKKGWRRADATDLTPAPEPAATSKKK
ncbi:VWA domain-containing protein [uncultured Paludibaculum sp.]|uniref:VWA domain-containing protein n=1 Tax=uncultured Paludibaculum sp. TaxID=1765020 RepID=UPI002AAAB537|nr:VWA domain-containing protein [uncultured Paludibaculum sp.]